MPLRQILIDVILPDKSADAGDFSARIYRPLLFIGSKWKDGESN
jgi:hypothetical protein